MGYGVWGHGCEDVGVGPGSGDTGCGVIGVGSLGMGTVDVGMFADIGCRDSGCGDVGVGSLIGDTDVGTTLWCH